MYLLFGIVSILGPSLSLYDAKIVWLMLNVSFIPVVFIIYNTHKRRTLYMEHVFVRAVQAVGIHAMCYVSLLTFLSVQLPLITYVEFYVACFIALPLWWMIARQIVKRYRRNGHNFSRVIIVGTNATALRLHTEYMGNYLSSEDLQRNLYYIYMVADIFEKNNQSELSKKYADMVNSYLQ